MTNHLLHFLALDRSDPKKFQILQLIAALLCWDEGIVIIEVFRAFFKKTNDYQNNVSRQDLLAQHHLIIVFVFRYRLSAVHQVNNHLAQIFCRMLT